MDHRVPPTPAAAALAAGLLFVAPLAAPLGAQPRVTQLGVEGAAVAGTVYDSLAGRPLAGATVQLAPAAASAATPLSATTDARGLFRIAHVAPGRYLIGFDHPRLDSLGLEAGARTVDVAPAGAAAAGEVRADLGLPSAAGVRLAVCGAGAAAAGVVIGRVRDAERGAPVEGGTVVVRWAELRLDRDRRGVHRVVDSVRATAGADGRFAVCGVPTGTDVLAQAAAGAAGTTGALALTLAAAQPLLYRDFLVAPAGAEARGTARVAGRVLGPDGRPLAGARVTVRGVGAGDSAAVTGDDGAYALDRLPAGTYSVEAFVVGFAPGRAAADLRANQAARVDLTMGARVAALAPVAVQARQRHSASGFAERMAQGSGRYVTGEEVVRSGVRTIGEALAGVPGLRIGAFSPGEGQQIRGRGGCTPAFYVDGVRVDQGRMGPAAASDTSLANLNTHSTRPPLMPKVREFTSAADNIDAVIGPREVGGIEVYDDPEKAPAQYRYGDCASVVVWSRGGVR